MGKGAAIYRIVLLLLFLLGSILPAQNSENVNRTAELDPGRIPISLMTKAVPTPNDPLETEIDYDLLLGVGGVTLGIGVAVHIYQANAWWQDQGSEFKVMNDWKYALWIDKVGHFYGTTLMAHGLSSGFEAANIDLERSALYGAIGAFAFETFIEIQDGFGPQWGFSPGDLAFDFLGALYSVGQYYYPTLKHIQPRVSYYPSEEYRNGEHEGNVIDDYAGQKYWMAFRMKELLPRKISEYWPSFLMISVGMGIRDWDGYGGGKQDFYIALDYDAETIPLYGSFWQFVKNTLNFIHFPMPGIRITPDTAAFIIVY